MSRFSNKSIGFAFGLVVYLYGAQAAEASFVTVCFDGESAGIEAFEPIGAGAVPDDTPKPDRSLTRLLFDSGLHALPADASSGMSTGVSSGPSVVPPAVLGDAYDCSSGQLVTYLAAQPTLLLPIPFLDGVFRPPQQV